MNLEPPEVTNKPDGGINIPSEQTVILDPNNIIVLESANQTQESKKPTPKDEGKKGEPYVLQFFQQEDVVSPPVSSAEETTLIYPDREKLYSSILTSILEGQTEFTQIICSEFNLRNLDTQDEIDSLIEVFQYDFFIIYENDNLKNKILHEKANKLSVFVDTLDATFRFYNTTKKFDLKTPAHREGVIFLSGLVGLSMIYGLSNHYSLIPSQYVNEAEYLRDIFDAVVKLKKNEEGAWNDLNWLLKEFSRKMLIQKNTIRR